MGGGRRARGSIRLCRRRRGRGGGRWLGRRRRSGGGVRLEGFEGRMFKRLGGGREGGLTPPVASRTTRTKELFLGSDGDEHLL